MLAVGRQQAGPTRVTGLATLRGLQRKPFVTGEGHSSSWSRSVHEVGVCTGWGVEVQLFTGRGVYITVSSHADMHAQELTDACTHACVHTYQAS